MKFSERPDGIRPGLNRVRIAKGFIGLGISAVFVALALRGVDLAQVLSHLREIDAGLLPPIFICLVVIFLLKTFRWQYLMSPVKRIAFGRVFSASIIGFMANNAMPLRTGDLLRAHLLGRRENIGTTAVFATVALDRVFEVFSLLTVSVLVLLMIPLPGWMWNSVVILGIALVGVTAGVVVFYRPPKFIEKWWSIGRRLLPDRAQEMLSTFIKDVRVGLRAGRGKVRLANLYFLAIGESAVWGVLTYCTLKTVGIQLPIVAIMSTMIACNLAVAVPAVPGNIGVFEFAVMTTLQFFQFDKDLALSGAVILHVIHVVPASLVGLVFFMGTWLTPKGVPK
jgi:uncharacterized protein (TIRG00374 family)